MTKSKIEWTDRTWNPITGCTKVSPGCANCYAERMAKWLRGRCSYPQDDPFKVTFHPDRIHEPRKWKKPCKIFVCSMSDLFHEDVKFEMIDKIWRSMVRNKQHVFIVLTKRPEKMLEWIHYTQSTAPNVWLGVSAENQQTADERIPILLQIPAAVRFVSCEPLLGKIEFSDVTNRSDAITQLGKKALNGIHWIIVGGESGPGARPMHLDWARSLRDQCQAAGVPFFFKQWGEWKPCLANYSGGKEHWFDDGQCAVKVGKKAAGRLLDGFEHNDFPV